MIELLRTNEPTVLSFATSLLESAKIACFVLDGHASAVDGSLSLLPRRLMVVRPFAREARELLSAAGLSAQLSSPDSEDA